MNKSTHSLAVIGAGPAGMMAALHAVRPGVRVLLIDSNPSVGRKLLVTGSGRCNLTNANVAAERYTCANPEFLQALFARFGHADLLAFMRDLGVLTYATDDGWTYPLSDSAVSVVEAFAAALDPAGVELRLETGVTDVRPAAGGFRLLTAGGEINAERVVLAAGGKAYPNLGSRGELFPVLERLGHTVRPVQPALAPLLLELKALQRLQGVRVDVRARLWHGREPLGETTGNCIFTQWGMNGPAVMDLSHHVSTRPGAGLRLELNFLPGSEAAVRELIARRRDTRVPLRVLLGAALPPKVPPVFLEMAGVADDAPLNTLSDDAVEKVLRLLTSHSLQVKGTRGFEFCQLSTGGVPVTEVDAATLQSRVTPGLYLAGEALDVVGPCGGYNLQFAFSSGVIAGRAAGDFAA